MKCRCWFGLHNWSTWTEPYKEPWAEYRRDKTTGVRTKHKEFTKVFQSRRCQDCRMVGRQELWEE